MIKKETRGRKPNKAKGQEVKKTYSTYLYPKQKKIIDKRYGSLAKYLQLKLAEDNI